MVRVSSISSSSQSSSSSGRHHLSQPLGGLAIDEHMPRPPAPETPPSHGDLAHTQAPPPPPHPLSHHRSHHRHVGFHESIPRPPAHETPAPHDDRAYTHSPPPHGLGYHHVGLHESMHPYPAAHESAVRHLFKSHNHFPPLLPPSLVSHHHSAPSFHGHPQLFGGAAVHDPMHSPHAALESTTYHSSMNRNQPPPPPPNLDYHSFPPSPPSSHHRGIRYGYPGYQPGRFSTLEGGEPHLRMEKSLPLPPHLRYCDCLDSPMSTPHGHVHGGGQRHPHHLGRRSQALDTAIAYQFIDHLDESLSPPPPPPPPYGHHIHSSHLDGSISPPPSPLHGHHIHSSHVDGSISLPPPPPYSHHIHSSHFDGSLSPPPPPPHDHHIHSSTLEGSLSPPPPPPPPYGHHVHSSHLDGSLSRPPHPPPPPPHGHHVHSSHLDGSLSSPPPPPYRHVHSSHLDESLSPPPPFPYDNHIHYSALEGSLSPPPPPPPPPYGHHIHSSPFHSFQHHAAKVHMRPPMEHSRQMLDDYEPFVSEMDLHPPHHYAGHSEHMSNLLPREEQYPPHKQTNDGYDDHFGMHGGHRYMPHDVNGVFYSHLMGGVPYPRHPPRSPPSRNRRRSASRPSHPRFCGAYAPAAHLPKAHLAVPVW